MKISHLRFIIIILSMLKVGSIQAESKKDALPEMCEIASVHDSVKTPVTKVEAEIIKDLSEKQLSWYRWINKTWESMIIVDCSWRCSVKTKSTEAANKILQSCLSEHYNSRALQLRTLLEP